MLRLLLALALAAPAAGQEPKSTATAVCQSATVTSPTPDNGCNFGACQSLSDDSLTCAYDSSFCDRSYIVFFRVMHGYPTAGIHGGTGSGYLRNSC